MIAPEMILMLIFIFIPIVYAFYISLFDWNAMGTKTFVGISNYLKMMQDLTFKSSLLALVCKHSTGMMFPLTAAVIQDHDRFLRGSLLFIGLERSVGTFRLYACFLV